MYRYIVSFGPKKNRSSVSFLKFAYAEKYFSECVAADRQLVQLDTVDDSVYLSEGEAFLREKGVM